MKSFIISVGIALLTSAIIPVYAQTRPILVDYLLSAQFDLSEDQTATLEAIRNDPAAKDVQLGQAYPDVVRDPLGFSIVLPARQEATVKVSVSFDDMSIMERGNQDYSLYSQNDARSEVSLVVIGLDVFGTINHQDEVYKIHPLGAGLTAIYRYDISLLQDHPENYEEIIEEQNQTDAVPEDSGTRTSVADRGVIIDVLVVYTNPAKQQANNIDALIGLAFDETNRIYANSQIKPSVRLVHSYLTNYKQHGDMSIDLDRLRKNNDGHMDKVHTKRNRYKADLVVLLIGRHGKYCGYGYLNSNSRGAFSVVSQNCATGYYSFAHEIGHNQGAHHDPDTSKNEYFPYGHGLCYKPGNWRTVMSYNSGNRCRHRLGYFSNPDVSYYGTATGDVSMRNNALVINKTANRIAKFR